MQNIENENHNTGMLQSAVAVNLYFVLLFNLSQLAPPLHQAGLDYMVYIHTCKATLALTKIY